MTALRLPALLGLLLTLAACRPQPMPPPAGTPKAAPPAQVVALPGSLENFGEAQLEPLARHLHDPAARVHIVQLGDSHTAADFFTGRLRQLLQQGYGDAGPGLLPPAQIRGQRSATLQPGPALPAQWQLDSSRLDRSQAYPLGGFMLTARQPGARLQIAPVTHPPGHYRLRALYRTPADTLLWLNGQPQALAASTAWQWSAARAATLPMQLQAADSRLQLAGWLVERDSPGVMLSALGINGAQLSMLERWQTDWPQQLQALQPDLLILAYGTNEAFDPNFDAEQYRLRLQQQLSGLRRHSPQAALLLIGPADALRQPQADSCAARQPAALAQIISLQRQAAQAHRALFWDWQAQMGGPCSIEAWQARGLAQADAVHLSRRGYEHSAEALAQALLTLLK